MHENKGARSGGAMQECGREELRVGRSYGRQAARMKSEAHGTCYQRRRMVSISSKCRSHVVFELLRFETRALLLYLKSGERSD